MQLAKDLLVQARHLAGLDPTRPKQANLRRAISSAYYAVFHLLIGEAVHQVTPRHRKKLMDRVSRTFQHREMREVCKSFIHATAPTIVYEILGGSPSTALRSVAETFIELQEARHNADYDVGARFTRAQTLAIVRNAESVFQLWAGIGEEEADVFLTALAFGSRWNK